jgi:RNA polymerase sigma factor (sigma-70 family)
VAADERATLGALPPEAEHVLRELAPRVLGALVRRSGDFAAAEDAVQEALVAAAREWPRSGVPGNPGGWLFDVARKRLADHVASERARTRREERSAARTSEAEEMRLSDTFDDAGDDDALPLYFTCCHPSLSTPSAIALTLRALGGLTTAEVASAFLVPEATMAQRISRAKQTIAASGIPLEEPAPAERARRLDTVLHVLYLMFNEGYAASSGAQVVRVELSSEAIRLTRLLQRVQPQHAETQGLLALMLLTDARRRARTGPEGEIVPLDEQDRSLWDRRAIEEGTRVVSQALARGDVGSYQLQAAIAALHDEASSTEATDWPQILALYELLQRLADNPMVTLNRAVAYAMVHGPRAGLELIDQLAQDERIARHFRLAAVRAHLLERSGERAAAKRHYLAAAEGTTSTAERNYLLLKAARIE